MNDLTLKEETLLTARLRDFVPPPPELTHLAARAESRSRRSRMRRGAAVVLAAAVLVAAVVTVPRLLHGPAPAEPSPARCVPDSKLDHRDFRTGTAVWVRFCSAEPVEAVALMPRTVLTSGAGSLVATWQAETTRPGSGGGFCPTGSPPGYTAQVGFADGTVAEVGIGCRLNVEPGGQDMLTDPDDVYDELVTAMGRQNDARYPTNPALPLGTCPATPGDPVRRNFDGASADGLGTTGPVLELTASHALVCRYSHGRIVQRVLGRDAEALRLATGIGWQAYDPRTKHALSFDPLYRHGVPTYLVALRDRTGTWRTFTITGRFGLLRIYRSDGTVLRVGYATSLLQSLGALALMTHRR